MHAWMDASTSTYTRAKGFFFLLVGMMWLRLLRIALSRRFLPCFLANSRFLVKETSES
jgi:hypothetical protein